MHDIPEPDSKGLRDFGLLFGGFVAALFGLVFPYLAGHGFPAWPWMVLGVTAAWSFTAPMSLRPFYRTWMRIGMTIGDLVNKVVLATVFFLVVTPLALVFRALGNDPMARRLDRDVESYRVKSRPRSRESMERPF